MIIPFFGDIGKTNISVSGVCSHSGFLLNISKTLSNSLKQDLIFLTRNHDLDEDEDERSIKILGIIALTFGILGMTFIKYYIQLLGIYQHQSTESVLSWFYAVSGGIVLFFVVFCIGQLLKFRSQKETREWHACEHKASVLLSKKLEPSIDSFSKCPKTLLGCGTSTIIIFLQIIIFLWIILASFTFEIPVMYIQSFNLSTIASGILVCVGGIRLMPLAIKKLVFIIFLPFALPFLIMPFLAEYFFVLKEPSKEKIEQTIQELKKFIDENHLYDS